MITIDVLCNSKSSRLGNNEVTTEVEFIPTNKPLVTHAVGAVIGMPKDPSLDLTDRSKELYNMLSNSFLISITDEKEAEKYKIGEIYTLTLDAINKSKK